MNYSVSNFEDGLLRCFKFVSVSNKICQMRSNRTPHKFLYEEAAESWNSDLILNQNLLGLFKNHYFWFCARSVVLLLYQNKQMRNFVMDKKKN